MVFSFRCAQRWLAVWAGCGAVAFAAHAVDAVPPSLEGRFAVGCSNVEQDFSRLRPGESGPDYWEGNPGPTAPRYVTDLLVDPAHALTYPVVVPARADNDVFERQGGRTLAYAAIVCYPTRSDNTRADYGLPSGARVPRMQRGADMPIFAANPDSADGRWPLLVLSHGLAGSPLGDDYVRVMGRLAAEGYIVLAPFHADARYSRIKLNDFSDYWYVLTRYAEIAEMQAIRPLGLKQGLDALLARPEYAAAIDEDQIVGFGASLGGMAMMLVQGAKMTTSWGGAERVIVRDPRYKAVVGYVPFSGYSFQAMFGASNQGVRSVRVPYLGIGGTADVVAPISRTSQMVEALGASKYFVTIEGMEHGFRVEDAPDVFGWTFAFLRAELSRQQADRTAFSMIERVAGGADDRLRIQKTLAWGPRDELEVVEYVGTPSGRYFMTGRSNEIALLDSYPALWSRTGQRFAAFRTDSAMGTPMCRFYAFDGGTLNTHFYGATASDCALVAAQPWARDEGSPLRVQPVLTPGMTCPPDMAAVTRLFNSASVNHRYVIDGFNARLPASAVWKNEGAVFCAARYDD